MGLGSPDGIEEAWRRDRGGRLEERGWRRNGVWIREDGGEGMDEEGVMKEGF